jgi:predicted methyltransferase
MGEIFNYATGAIANRRQGHQALKETFRSIYEALQPGGLLWFDGAEPGRSAHA